MKLQKAIALRISNLMRLNNYSQYELSKRSTVEQSTIFHILNEDTKHIKIQTIFKIADAFNLSLKEFFDDNLFDKTNIEI
ncbi:MAG TPA: helix-turn-helix transcriptional regulator [Candidatus Onthoplasma faecipullorum]|nr:helix-turn-helix transcriptional regulator [Candidatus Onthoplasma faecipullorum]